MAVDNYGRYSESEVAQRTSARVFAMLSESADEPRFLSQLFPLIANAAEASYLGVVRGGRGRWDVVAEFGRPANMPHELFADTLDRELVSVDGDWVAAPLSTYGGTGELLVGAGSCADDLGRFDALTGLFGAALSEMRRRLERQQRIARLEAMLEIAAQWRQTLELTELLEQMAEASTRLLDAERASIFLWDKATHTLVGRPALGVEGGELRIPEDRGLVGQVIRSGELRRVDMEDQSEIDRSVDEQLQFETRSLLCAPLRGKSGELFGAFEMINKRSGNFGREDEIALRDLAAHAAVALENTQEHEQLIQSRNQVANEAEEGVQLIGECPQIQALRSTVRRVAESELALLILGENGTGKEVVSQLVHYWSNRRAEPFVAVNCAALTETLLESELFGHEKGAFTDASESRVGKFELASGGTLFLDEIGDMSLGGQAKLLRVLEEKVVVRVGGSQPIPTDARVIAATNQDLGQMVRDKRFREDLFYRLNVATLDLPPLRERGEDIALLAEHFLKDFCGKARRRPPKLTAAAKRELAEHPWPGNIRELRNLMERLAYLGPEDAIDVGDLAFTLSPGADDQLRTPLNLKLTEATRRFQVDYIQRQIKHSGGNMTTAAKKLGLHRSNLYRKMRQLGLEVDEAKS